MNNAYAYLRVSGRGQIAGDGFPRQIAAIKAYAASNNITIAGTYREKGVCGATDAADRPAWVEMIANGVTTVIIEKLDRLARDLMVQEHILADLQRRGITLISVAEPDLCSNEPTRKLMRQIMGAIAEYDRQMIVLKLRGARMRKRATDGRCEGRKPFGHREGEMATLELMRALWSAHSSLTAVCKGLAEAGISTRTGKPWHPYTVSAILARG